MNREWISRILVLVFALLAGWWLVTSTEWTEVEVDTPPQGEAARNPFYVTQLVLQQLGARVEKHTGLEPLPPDGARLLLDSRHWDLFPGRAERLRRWVEAGGHLVVHASMLDEEALAWVPVVLADRPHAPGTPAPRPLRRADGGCRTLLSDGGSAEYRVCAAASGSMPQPANGARATWQVQGPSGPELLRVALGRGTVTVTSPWALMRNEPMLRRDTDHALLMAQALQASPGALVWIVAEESREPFLRWLWQQAWIAVLLALAALGAWLWRSGARFGPVGVVPPPERRSMVEQVTGTGAFLRHHAPAALHAAQLRALRETARRRLPGFEKLGRPDAAAAIARATGVPALDLQQAMQPLAAGAPLPTGRLELLEQARRRLADVSTGALPRTP